MKIELKRVNKILLVVIAVVTLFLLWQAYEWALVANEVEPNFASTIEWELESCPVRTVEVFGQKHYVFHESYFIPEILKR